MAPVPELVGWLLFAGPFGTQSLSGPATLWYPGAQSTIRALCGLHPVMNKAISTVSAAIKGFMRL